MKNKCDLVVVMNNILNTNNFGVKKNVINLVIYN